jgi:hypothetical protein
MFGALADTYSEEVPVKKSLLFATALFLFSVTVSHAADPLGDMMKGFKLPAVPSRGLDDATIVSGLKEALSVGTGNAVTSTSALDGYFANQAIKILMPESIRKVTDVMAKFGYQKEVDEFVLSMNRAAEKAAPYAREYFVDAIKQMTFEDARKIWQGSDTAATEYFKSKTSDKLYNAFKPTVSESMDQVGTTKAYKDMMGTYTSIPFMKAESLDLDHYVTTKSLDGLFYVVGQEEKKIRTNPAARTTDLLKTVFGKK